jgi:hypothetical protein
VVATFSATAQGKFGEGPLNSIVLRAFLHMLPIKTKVIPINAAALKNRHLLAPPFAISQIVLLKASKSLTIPFHVRGSLGPAFIALSERFLAAFTRAKFVIPFSR